MFYLRKYGNIEEKLRKGEEEEAKMGNQKFDSFLDPRPPIFRRRVCSSESLAA